jgi:hypothetical protein
MTGKTQLDLSATTVIDLFDTVGMYDRRDYGIRASLMYQMTGKTSIGPSFHYGYTDIDNNNDQSAYEFGLKGEYQATGKTALTGTVGYNLRTFDGSNASDDESTIAWSLGARYAATAKTNLTALFYRTPRMSYNFQDTGYMATGISLEATYMFSPRVHIFGVTSYENDDYYKTGNTGNGVSFDHDYFRATMGANYQMANGFMVGGNMTWRSNTADNSFSDYDNFSCGINASYSFW